MEKTALLCANNCEYCPFEYCIKTKEKEYQHFSGIVAETHRSIFYINTEGYAYRIDKFTKKRILLRAALHGGQARVSIHSLKNPELKRLVYLVAKGKPLEPNVHVQCIDGNEMNCNITNLKTVSKSEAGAITGPMSRSRAVIIKDSEGINEYRSVREAAKALYCSYQTLLDYLAPKKRYKHSVLDKRGRRICYKEELNSYEKDYCKK